MDANWEEIRKEYESSKVTMQALADKHGVKIGTLKSRKSREGWSRVAIIQKDAKKKDATKGKKVATKKKRAEPKKRSGNPNPTYKFPKHNTINTKHGLYSKYLHAEQIEIMEATKDMEIPDFLWFQIQLSFSSIVRLQKIMVVDEADSLLKEGSGHSWGDGVNSETFKVAFAYEQYESYIRAQSRAMGEFRGLVKQFDELAHIDDERRLKLDLMKLGIEKTKAEVDKLSNNDDSQETDVAAALRGLVDGINSKTD